MDAQEREDVAQQVTACRHCGRTIRRGDTVAPWVHVDSGNGFCDVAGPADAVDGRRMPPQERYEAEPA